MKNKLIGIICLSLLFVSVSVKNTFSASLIQEPQKKEVKKCCANAGEQKSCSTTSNVGKEKDSKCQSENPACKPTTTQVKSTDTKKSENAPAASCCKAKETSSGGKSKDGTASSCCADKSACTSTCKKDKK